MTVDGVREHLGALQSIADDGNRASGTPGYDASAGYVHFAARDLGEEPLAPPGG